jgi:hypothetical protein
MMIDVNHFFSRSRSLGLAGLLALALPLACNQPPPPGSEDEEGESSTASAGTSDTDTGETGTDTSEDGGSLYPLVDGAQWTYVITSTSGQVLGMDVTSMSETTWDGMQAWELADEPNANGNSSISVLIRDGDVVLRVHREEMDQVGTTAIIDYVPGFPRASDAWTSVGVMEEFLYDRTAYDANGLNPVVEARGHTYEVLAIDESVTVPAGTFECVKVERVRTVGAEAGALVWFWFAPGVGKVREERPIEMEIEELASVSIPGGVNLP